MSHNTKSANNSRLALFLFDECIDLKVAGKGKNPVLSEREFRFERGRNLTALNIVTTSTTAFCYFVCLEGKRALGSEYFSRRDVNKELRAGAPIFQICTNLNIAMIPTGK